MGKAENTKVANPKEYRIIPPNSSAVTRSAAVSMGSRILLRACAIRPAGTEMAIRPDFPERSAITLLVKRVDAALRTAVRADTGGGHWWRTLGANTVQDRMEDVTDV
jgi:hypothetical protein